MLAVNAFFAESPTTGTSRAARAYREAHGRPPYRRISYALVAPSRRGEIGALAEAVFQERYGGLRGLRSPDFALLARLLGGGRAQSRGELLSFVLFDEVFIERLLQAGRADAQRWLRRHPGFWSSDAAAAGFEAAGDSPRPWPWTSSARSGGGRPAQHRHPGVPGVAVGRLQREVEVLEGLRVHRQRQPQRGLAVGVRRGRSRGRRGACRRRAATARRTGRRRSARPLTRTSTPSPARLTRPLADGSRSPTGSSASFADGAGRGRAARRARRRGEQRERAGRGDEWAQDERRGARARVARLRGHPQRRRLGSSHASAGSRSSRETTGRSRSTSARSAASPAIARSNAAVSDASSSPSR